MNVKMIHNIVDAFEDELKSQFHYDEVGELWCTVDKIEIDFNDAEYEKDMKSMSVTVSFGRYVEKGNNNFRHNFTIYDVKEDATYDYFRGVAHIVILAKDGSYDFSKED
jgi:hypothetical protein